MSYGGTIGGIIGTTMVVDSLSKINRRKKKKKKKGGKRK